MSLALIVSILFIAGCDNISVIGDKDNDGDTVPRTVDNPPPEEPAPPEEPTDPNGPVDPGLPDESDPGGPILLSLRDVNGDGIQDIAVIIEDPTNEKLTATVKDANNNLINTISFTGDCRLLSAVPLPDMNGDLGMELAVICRDRSTGEPAIEIRNPSNGGLIRNMRFSSDLQLLFTSTVEDVSGDGFPELAALFKETAPTGLLFTQIINPLDGVSMNNVYFDNRFIARDLLSIPDMDRSGIPEIVFLGETSKGEFRTVIRDAQSNAIVSTKSLGSQFTVKQLSVAPNRNGDSIEEIAALRQDRSLTVLLYQAFDGALSNVVNFNPEFKSEKMLILADINGNGALELAVLGLNPKTDSIKTEVRDARTGDLLSNVLWPTLYLPVDTVTMTDINFNGSQELVYLGRRDSDGKLMVYIKDSITNELLGTIDF
ncbi:hypothetical protein [Ketobacter sp.]